MKPFMKFLPLLILYSIVILLLSKDLLLHDEPRYLMYAQNLIKGYFTESDNPNLLNGPGYPFYLFIFVKLGLPFIIPKLLNGVFVFFAVIYFYKALLFYVQDRTALIYAYILGLYYPMFRWMPLNITESISLFLLCGFIFYIIKLLRSDKRDIKTIALSVFFLGYLIITKLIFGYVVLAAIFLSLGIFAIFRNQKSFNYSLVITLAWLIFVGPFLMYTYSLTGRPFYWSTLGGEPLYWMTTKYENEYGKWFGDETIYGKQIPDMHPTHQALYNSIVGKTFVERNDIFMNAAKENIKDHPENYISNVLINPLRLMSGYPISYAKQDLVMYFYLFPNILLILLFALSLYPAWLFRRHVPLELVSILLLGVIYFGVSMLLSSVPRYFLMIVPVLLIWMAFIYANFVQVIIAYKGTN